MGGHLTPTDFRCTRPTRDLISGLDSTIVNMGQLLEAVGRREESARLNEGIRCTMSNTATVTIAAKGGWRRKVYHLTAELSIDSPCPNYDERSPLLVGGRVHCWEWSPAFPMSEPAFGLAEGTC
ncbi:hypothetical protein AVEN_151983-1 [Araneus ventricosus]|uniref:Uncharacterized protein n=1 Tax=Araneus ventricosus TaxID=182803 RepID=A0A4Y2T7B5_ARAVE|nr:hypothetical protein AVEN_151983-1 [Araneus ventricosus]